MSKPTLFFLLEADVPVCWIRYSFIFISYLFFIIYNN
jgi:hypothetical protein